MITQNQFILGITLNLKLYVNNMGNLNKQQAIISTGEHNSVVKFVVKMTPNAKMKTTEQFIGETTKVHGDTYDYSKNVVYTGAHIIKLKFYAKNMENLNRFLESHLQVVQGCRECGIIKISQSLTKTTEQFIEQAKALHGDKYDYSKVMNIMVTV